MKSFFKFVFMIVLVVGIAAAVASVVSKKRLMTMSDDEIRDFLSAKIGTRVGEDQLGVIQEAVIGKVRGKKAAAGHYTDESEEDSADVDPDGVDVEADDAEESDESDEASESLNGDKKDA